MNPTNRRRHLESCPSCREKGEREQRITTFFHKKVSQDGDVRSVASSSGANVEEDDVLFTVETLEEISVEAEVVVHTEAGIIDIHADIVAESGSKEANVDAEEEICADADIDSGHHETVNLNLKCEGYRLMVLNPADIYKLFPFTLLANENFVFENGCLHHKQCVEGNYMLHNTSDGNAYCNKQC